ncbi:acyl carrier protein [Paraneptunicella aestuarii]|uniref:acyl carrier protein n=1 Tax=Paraneptunicella aestuarii TaxID=2831148 RepID=UPI001E580896|nr:acyl carrier protein [Paraneptunicella aestuarii]UAA37466.1 acyl carrier protein [Paraneptunicella aestuarii]
MNSTEVKEKIIAVIQEVAATQDLNLPDLKDSQEIVDDLGFTSLGVAALIANLEEVFGIDPFEDEDVMITDIRTIKDLCKVYAKSLEKSA